MSRIDDAMVEATMRGYDRNNLFAFVAAIIGSDEARRLMEMYRVGTSKHWQGATVFWQISNDGEVRGGKIMLYDRLTGHRVQEPFPHINWVHSVLRLPDFKLTQCFFGEHLLPYIRDKPVAIVESEKTAILATHYLPQYLWLATGGKCSCLTREAIQALRGREVMLVPDLNATDDWRKKLTLFDDSGIKATLFESLEQMATDEQREQGLDIADFLCQRVQSQACLSYAECSQERSETHFLIAEQTPHGILEQMMQRNPALRQLVDALHLELVGIEEYKPSEISQKSE